MFLLALSLVGASRQPSLDLLLNHRVDSEVTQYLGVEQTFSYSDLELIQSAGNFISQEESNECLLLYIPS